MVVPIYNTKGESVGEVELRPDIFQVPVKVPLMHQALVRQLANARRGTHKTKSRGEINRTTAKMYRQKGTGNARHGSRNAPLFVGGGIAHGPKPRSYAKKMPRKMRRAALRSALSAKAGDGQIVVLDALEMSVPRTKEMLSALANIGLDGRILIVLPGRDDLVEKSARNLPQVKTLRAQYLNIRDLMGTDHVVMPLGSLDVIESILG